MRSLVTDLIAQSTLWRNLVFALGVSLLSTGDTNNYLSTSSVSVMLFQRARKLLHPAIFPVAVGTFFGFQLLHSLYFHVVSQSWQPVDATVIAIERRPRIAELRYTYKIDGNELTGNTFCFLSEGSSFDKLIITKQYRVGNQIEVYVNSSNPNQSVVQRRSLHFKYLKLHLLVLGVCGIMAVAFWHRFPTKT